MFSSVLKRPTRRTRTVATSTLFIFALGSGAAAADKGRANAPVNEKNAILWKDPADIATRDLFYGAGGKDHEPHPPFTFVKEDMDGTNPKFVVTDADGAKWKVKLGREARPETAASRLVWAAGYFVNDDYFLRDFQVSGMPILRRGDWMVSPDGSMHNVRLKRESKDMKKAGDWKWRDNPFSSTPELNGLRTLMALIDNWDLKDVNNAVYPEDAGSVYLVSDLGASFGSPNRSWPGSHAKDNLGAYSHARFIRKSNAEAVDFQTPGRPALIYIFDLKEYVRRIHLEWTGRDIPRADAKHIGEVLARLSHEQIEAAFRASGYSPAEVDAFSKVVEARIQALTDL